MKLNESIEFYKNLDNYKKLHFKDQEFFDVLFLTLVIRPITESNKDISKSLKISVSTLEKKLKRLEASGLISRTSTNAYNQFGKLRCIARTIKLNTITFSQILEDSNEWIRSIGKNRF